MANYIDLGNLKDMIISEQSELNVNDFLDSDIESDMSDSSDMSYLSEVSLLSDMTEYEGGGKPKKAPKPLTSKQTKRVKVLAKKKIAKKEAKKKANDKQHVVALNALPTATSSTKPKLSKKAVKKEHKENAKKAAKEAGLTKKQARAANNLSPKELGECKELKGKAIEDCIKNTKATRKTISNLHKTGQTIAGNNDVKKLIGSVADIIGTHGLNVAAGLVQPLTNTHGVGKPLSESVETQPSTSTSGTIDPIAFKAAIETYLKIINKPPGVNTTLIEEQSEESHSEEGPPLAAIEGHSKYLRMKTKYLIRKANIEVREANKLIAEYNGDILE